MNKNFLRIINLIEELGSEKKTIHYYTAIPGYH